MTEYYVEIAKAELDRRPRFMAQRSFWATDARAAERMGVAWAAEFYGGHPENYDAKAHKIIRDAQLFWFNT